jgi:hypothetical protein
VNPPPAHADPERFWAEILSGDSARVRQAFARLAPDERHRVLDHLRRMADEEGWQPGQRRRARAALAAVDDSRAGC